MPKTFEIEVTVPEGVVSGDTFVVEVEAPKRAKGTGSGKGQLVGLTLEEMTDLQLKREIVNAGSVLYKATKRGAPAATIEANQIRLDAARAEKASRAPIVAVEEEVASDEIYVDETAAEI